MYQYIWDTETGGLLLTTEQSKFSKEPRPVYYEELDTLGFDKYWNYPKDNRAPLLWAETNSYVYRGRTVAKTKGGSLYTKPEIIIVDEPEPNGEEMQFINVNLMVYKNKPLIETLAQETIQKIYNTYWDHKGKVNIFYVAFSGGKDSVVTLDLVQRALPHNDFMVLFGDTRMEFPDTYKTVEKIKILCEKEEISFYTAQSKLLPSQTWKVFGPPATTNRWCCSVHKTSPQINLLREIIGKYDFTGMAFTGIRADESQSRSEYDLVSEGQKHSGQFSCHSILEWNSAEVFLYIYSRKLVMNRAYMRGNVRAGCLVCPNSSGKHDYIKRCAYTEQVDQYLAQISSTSGKTNYTDSEMKMFIDSGYWRTRKSGRELNFGQDKFEFKVGLEVPTIDVYIVPFTWKKWAKTVGKLTQLDDELYSISYKEKIYQVHVTEYENKTTFRILNCNNTKNDVKLQSLLRSVIIKSIYCVSCGTCEAECKNNCINMKNGLEIGDNCTHCYKCHEIYEHCLRYNSIRNKNTEGRKMAGLDRYFSFGARAQWLQIYTNYSGEKEFWLSDGDGQVVNKKKDAFLNFAKDAGLVLYDKKVDGDKYTKCLPTIFSDTIVKLGGNSEVAWALILCNLVYSPTFNWLVMNLNVGNVYSSDAIILMLSDVMANDLKGHGKKNVVDSLKVFLGKTPLGKEHIFAICDIDEKINSAGNENLTLNSVEKCTWENPIPEVILYALYKFAEACENCYQFTLRNLMDESIERDGISPTQLFGLDKDTMIRVLNGLSINYSEYVSASFTLDMDNITLRSDKTATDILSVF